MLVDLTQFYFYFTFQHFQSFIKKSTFHYMNQFAKQVFYCCIKLDRIRLRHFILNIWLTSLYMHFFFFLRFFFSILHTKIRNLFVYFKVCNICNLWFPSSFYFGSNLVLYKDRWQKCHRLMLCIFRIFKKISMLCKDIEDYSMFRFLDFYLWKNKYELLDSLQPVNFALFILCNIN